MEYVKIKEVAEVVSGSTPKTNIDEYWNGEYNWITPKEITEDNKYIYNTERTLSIDGIKSCALKELKVNTVLLTSRAPIGKVALVGKTMYCNQGFKNLVCNEQVINPEYMYYWLKSHNNYLNSLGRGATFKEISKKIVEDIEIPLQDLDTQNKIVEILDKAQELIDKRKEQMELLDELVQSKFIELFGEPVLNPKRWDVKNVIEVCDCMVPGRDKPKSFTGDTPWITIEDLEVNGVTYKSKSNLGLTDEEINQVKRKKIPKGSVIMSCVGNLGICSIAGTDVIINQQLHSFQCKDINNFFLMYYLGFRKDYMELKASSTTVLYMNKTVCNSIPVYLPPLELQEEFADFVEKVNDIKAVLNKSLEQLNNNFDSLINRAFKGELF